MAEWDEASSSIVDYNTCCGHISSCRQVRRITSGLACCGSGCGSRPAGRGAPWISAACAKSWRQHLRSLKIRSGWRKNGENEQHALRFWMRCSAMPKRPKDGLCCLDRRRIDDLKTVRYSENPISSVHVEVAGVERCVLQHPQDMSSECRTLTRTTSPNPRRVDTALST